MREAFMKYIEQKLIDQVKQVVTEAEECAKSNDWDAIGTLECINDGIDEWLESVNDIINVDKWLDKINEIKKPYIIAAKKEVATNISNIIETEKVDVTSKINDYVEELNKMNINLDVINSDKEEKTNDLISEVKEEMNKIDKESRHKKAYELEKARNNQPRERVLVKSSESIYPWQRRDCYDSGCGSSGGGGGCC